MRRVTAATADTISRYVIEPRCLIRGDGSTGSFPGDFVELEKWFRQPQRRVGPPDDRISPSVIFVRAYLIRCEMNQF